MLPQRLRTASLFAIVLWLINETPLAFRDSCLGGPSLRGESGSSLLHGTVPRTGCMARMGFNPSYLLQCAYFLICPTCVGVTQLVSGTLSDRIAQRVTVYSAHPWEKWNSGSSCTTILALSLFYIFHFSSSSILVFWCTFNFSFHND